MQLIDPVAPEEMAERVRVGFRAAFGVEAEAVGRAPGRVNLIGEHTDYNGGLCLPVALPHATYAACAVRGDRRLRVSSAQAGVWEGALADVHPGAVPAGGLPGWAAYVAGVPWALAQLGWDVPGLDVHLDSTVPWGAGLSSSAALECAVAVAIARFVTGMVNLDAPLRETLAAACVRAETEIAGAPTGGMDQAVSLLAHPGEAVLLDFLDGSRRRVPLQLAPHGLTLLVVDTRVSHALVDGGYAARRADCDEAARLLGVASLGQAPVDAWTLLPDTRVRRRARHVLTEIDRVRQTLTALADDDHDRVGRLFVASHASLRDDFAVSCPELDLAVDKAVAAGALGARMTGGGFGGSAVALVPERGAAELAGTVESAFHRAGFGTPGFLLAEPAVGATVLPAAVEP